MKILAGSSTLMEIHHFANESTSNNTNKQPNVPIRPQPLIASIPTSIPVSPILPTSSVGRKGLLVSPSNSSSLAESVFIQSSKLKSSSSESPNEFNQPSNSSSSPAATRCIFARGDCVDSASLFFLYAPLFPQVCTRLMWFCTPELSEIHTRFAFACARVSGLGIAVNKERNLDIKQNKDGSIDGSSEKATSLDMKAFRFEYAMNELLGYLGETDVLIGQGLRGQLGVSAPAQIQMLASLDEARREFDEMMSVLPDKI